MTDDIARARARRDGDKALRQAKRIAESIAERDRVREAAAATCADEAALRASMAASIARSTGCPKCGASLIGFTLIGIQMHLDGECAPPTGAA